MVNGKVIESTCSSALVCVFMMSGHTNAGVAQCTHTDAVVWALILMLWYGHSY